MEVAYSYLMKALKFGVTNYDAANAYFRKYYDVLAPLFVKTSKLPVEVCDDTKPEILNMHEAFVNEIKNDFSTALGKDRLYHKPAGFIND